MWCGVGALLLTALKKKNTKKQDLFDKQVVCNKYGLLHEHGVVRNRWAGLLCQHVASELLYSYPHFRACFSKKPLKLMVWAQSTQNGCFVWNTSNHHKPLDFDNHES